MTQTMAGKRPSWMPLFALAALVGMTGVAPRAHALQPGEAVAHAPPRVQERASRPAQSARRHEKTLTLEQAVARVQNQVGGKVLKADSRNLGRYTEYRIKVLTPQGHVRVVTVRSDGRGD